MKKWHERQQAGTSNNSTASHTLELKIIPVIKKKKEKLLFLMNYEHVFCCLTSLRIQEMHSDCVHQNMPAGL